MATPKEELSTKMLSTFDMKKLIWTFKKKNHGRNGPNSIYFGKNNSHIAKTFL